jgi:DNA-3-methyladenine glycosylase
VTSADGWLPCEHFAGNVVELARDLLGRTLRVRGAMEQFATIVETEAFAGLDDPASHAAFRPGGRAAVMRERAGLIYVYAAYGMYPCFNIVCGAEGEAAAVLLRGVWIVGQPKPVLGPGRATRALGIGLSDHGQSVSGERFAISAARADYAIEQLPRVGITRGVELPWRFLARESSA